MRLEGSSPRRLCSLRRCRRIPDGTVGERLAVPVHGSRTPRRFDRGLRRFELGFLRFDLGWLRLDHGRRVDCRLCKLDSDIGAWKLDLVLRRLVLGSRSGKSV